jgi:hypothetical protein
LLKDKGEPGFKGCDPTIQFCRRINEVSDVLNSKDSYSALRTGSKQERALEDSLAYLDVWECCAEPNYFLTRSTALGLRAIINTTLDLLKYCTTVLGFKYLMTTRIKQDPLEHFFAQLRGEGGANTNPETLQVVQIFKLLSLYSLVKPPKGSNFTGENLLDALVRQKDETVSYNTTKK